MKVNQTGNRRSEVPKDAVSLISEPELKDATPPHGIKSGYYDSKQLLQLLDQHKCDADAIQLIADMVETGDPENEGFVRMLRKNRRNPLTIARIVQNCGP
jgi:hypothetical protein